MDWLKIQDTGKIPRSFHAGPKARGLMTLQDHRLAIPDSWILCCEALYGFCEPGQILPGLCFPEARTLPNTHTDWVSQLRQKAIPQSWKTQIDLICSDYPDQRMIVRSSHNIEDTDTRSFAGTYLSVVCHANPAEIVDAIKDICIDAYDIRVQSQVLEAGYNPRNFRPGVIIQPHISGQASGILFSKNPANPWSDERLCEWSECAAEKLVSGTITGESETWVAGSPPDQMIMKELERGCSELKPVWPVLDAEWIYAHFRVIWLQARPVADHSLRLAHSYKNRSFSMNRRHMKERFPEPLSRLGWSVLNSIISGNLKALEKNFGLINPPEEEILVNDRGVIYSNSDFFELKNVRWKKSYLLRLCKPLEWLKIGRNFFRHRNITVLKFQLTELYLRPVTERILAEWPQQGATLPRPSAASNDLLSFAEQIKKLREKSQKIFSSDMSTFVLREILNKFFVKILDGPENVQLLLNKKRWLNKKLFEDVFTLQKMMQGFDSRQFISDLSTGKLNRSLLPDDVLHQWDDFMNTWGYMNSSWDIRDPAWKDAPEHLAPFFCANPDTNKTHPDSGPTEESRKKFKVLEKKLSDSGLKNLFEQFSGIVEADDREHYEGACFLSGARSLFVNIGKHLTEINILAHHDQIFGLTLDEINDALSGPPQYTRRYLADFHSGLLKRAQNTKFPDELGGQVLENSSELAKGNHHICGTKVSSGRVSGRLLIVRSRKDLTDLGPDTILAITNPNPDYIPVFSRIKGLICESGGLLAHSFVVCREIMLPALTDVKDLTRCFESGDEIILDACNGIIHKAGTP